MKTSQDEFIRGGGGTPPCAGVTPNVLPEVQTPIEEKNSQTGVSTRNALHESNDTSKSNHWYALRCTEYNQASVKALTEKLDKEGWAFAYIGANQDAMAVSHSLGIMNAINFDATVHGTVAMCGRLNASRERWFSRIAEKDANANEDFFDEK